MAQNCTRINGIWATSHSNRKHSEDQQTGIRSQHMSPGIAGLHGIFYNWAVSSINSRATCRLFMLFYISAVIPQANPFRSSLHRLNRNTCAGAVCLGFQQEGKQWLQHCKVRDGFVLGMVRNWKRCTHKSTMGSCYPVANGKQESGSSRERQACTYTKMEPPAKRITI